MPSPRYIQQTTWYIDPQNSSGVANDNNSGLTALLPLRTFKEYHRRVGTSLSIGAGVAYIIHVLSNGNEDDPVDLEVSFGDANASLQLLADVEAGTETTVASFSAAIPASNTLPNVQMASPIFTAADENTHLVYYPAVLGWSPVALHATDPARLLMSSILSPDGTVTQVQQDDTIRRVLPKNLWIANFKKTVESESTNRMQLRAVGFNIQKQTNVQNATLIGCLLNSAYGLLETDLLGCKSSCAASTRSSGFCRWAGCFLDGRVDITQLGESDQISLFGPMTTLSLIRGIVSASPGTQIVIYNAMSDGCTLLTGRNSAVLFGAPLALFGTEIVVSILGGAIVQRSTLGWDNSASGNPVITWPNPIGNVYNAASLVPPGPAAPVNPATQDWAGYGVVNWIDQLSGARLN